MVGAEVCGGLRDLEYEAGALGSHELTAGAADDAVDDECSGGDTDPLFGIGLPDIEGSGLEDSDSDSHSVGAGVGEGLDQTSEMAAVQSGHVASVVIERSSLTLLLTPYYAINIQFCQDFLANI